MKQTFLLAFTLLCFYQSTVAQKMVETDRLPTTIEEFVAFRDKVAKTPEGGASVFAMAMILYTEDKDLGKQALTVALDLSELSSGNVYKGYSPPSGLNFHLTNLEGKPYIARSYIFDTKASDGYKVPSKIKFKVTQNSHSRQNNGDMRVFVQSTGADTPRPITMRKNSSGVWKAVNYNSLFVGVVPPVQNIVDDL